MSTPTCWCGNTDLTTFSPEYLRCDCGTLVDRLFPQEDLTRVEDRGEFYSRDYYLKHLPEDYGLPTLPERARGDLPERDLHWLRTLLSYKLPPSRILELGSAHGGFVALMRWAGFDATGLELSPWLAEYARRTFDVPMLVGPIEDHDLAPGSLDCVALMDVLEHLQDPVRSMGGALASLKRDGVLLIQTPCFPDDLTYEQMRSADHLFLAQLRPREHLFLFSRRSIQALFGRLGAPHLVFEPAIFAYYDMFLAVGRTPAVKHQADDIVTALGSRAGGRMVLALLDLDDRLREHQDEAAREREEVARARDEALRVRDTRLAHVRAVLLDIRRSKAYRWLRRLGRWEALDREIDVALAPAASDGPAPPGEGARPAAAATTGVPAGGTEVPAGAAARVAPGALPRISVITPSYNQGRFLEECIRSVLGQGYPNLEYIVVDGGSTDDSVAIIRKHEAELAWWVSEPDAGQSDAINKGFRRATGDLVAWLNADDHYLPGALEAVAAAYRRDPTASFYFGNGLRVDEAGKPRGSFVPEGRPVFSYPALVYGLNYVLQPATFINRQALAQVGGLDVDLHYGMDTDLWIRLARVAPPAAVDGQLAASREHGDTKTSTGSFERIEELRRIAERHSGVALTPGVLCYFLDTLQRLVQLRPDVYPPRFVERVQAFWQESSRLLARYQARPDGFPVRSDGGPAPAEQGTARTGPTPGARPAPSGGPTIGVDLRHVALGPAGGVAQLVAGVLSTAFRLFPRHRFVLFCTIFNRSLLERLPVNVEARVLPTRSYYAALGASIRAGGVDELDVLVRTYPEEVDLDFPVARQIFLVPDLQHDRFPEFFPPHILRDRRLSFGRALARAGAIWTLSEFTQASIRSSPWTRCDDVFIAGPALPVGSPEAPPGDLAPGEQRLIPDVPFFLYPANLWPHKNHTRIFQAFGDFLRQTGREMAFVCTGHPDGWDELRARFPDLPIRHLGYVRPRLLRALYARASALVFFSLYEGFGIPLLEAFEAGLPVVCSDATSLPEIGGDAVLKCDPTDVRAMSDLLRIVVEDRSERERLVAAGRARPRAYTWERSARRLVDAAARVAERAAGPRASPSIPAGGATGRPLVSIVTPSLNQGRFLRAAIDSVLGQSYPRIEYIVMDGGSTDDSRAILESYGERVRWVSRPDRGQADAINQGFAMSSGEIRAYLNSDDVLTPGAIERVVAHFEDHPDCDLVYGRAHYLDEEGRVTGSYATAEYSFGRLMETNCICQPAAFWRTRIAERVGGFSEDLRWVLDFEYWLRIDRAGGRIQHIEDVLGAWRVYPGIKSRHERQGIYREIVRVCERHGGQVSLHWLLGLWHHRVMEKTDGWARWLRRVPRGYQLAARLHHLGRRMRVDGLAGWGTPMRALVRRVPGVRRAKDLIGRRVTLVNRWCPVLGYDADNWLDPVCQFRIGSRPLDGRPYIRGSAATDTTLVARLGRHVVAVHALKGGRDSTIHFDLAPDGRRTSALTLSFSDYVRSGRRRRAFLLQDTNLFTEIDALRSRLG
jgi:glycosyltransferase involved in cell wall biosynthesis/SAM-dependent methyltransferase